MQSLAEIAFFVPLAALVYAYFGYPLLIAIAGSLRRGRVEQRPITPRLSLIIAAYNEERAIVARLENALSLDYPPKQLEIIVASDGSEDATEELVSQYAGRGVCLLRLPRRGKIPALHAAAMRATGEILVFSDANSIYHRLALRNLARNFADPAVGGVAGRTVYAVPADAESCGRGEKLYWNYDIWLKQLESRTGNVVSAHGGIYAIRRALFQTPREPYVTDDFAISTGVIEQGRRLVFEGEACAYEDTVPETRREFQRRVRLMTRGFRGVLLRRRLLNPFRYGFYSLVLFSHKVLRRLAPLGLPALLVSSLYLSAESWFYRGAALAQAAFYILAAAGYFLRGTRFGQWKWFFVPFFYCMASAASLVALGRMLSGERVGLWQPQRHETVG